MKSAKHSQKMSHQYVVTGDFISAQKQQIVSSIMILTLITRLQKWKHLVTLTPTMMTASAAPTKFILSGKSPGRKCLTW